MWTDERKKLNGYGEMTTKWEIEKVIEAVKDSPEDQ
jgi:hypothetical protein